MYEIWWLEEGLRQNIVSRGRWFYLHLCRH